MPVYVGATPESDHTVTVLATYDRPLTRYEVYLYGTHVLPRRVDVAAGDVLVVPETAYVESYGTPVVGTRPAPGVPPPPPPPPPLVPRPGPDDAGKILVVGGAGNRYTLVTPSTLADARYEHAQLSAATTWTIPHNLGKWPAVTVVDSGGTVVVGDVSYSDENTAVVRFTAAFAGRAYCN